MVDEPGALTAIYEPEINLCQWQRKVDERACTYAAQTLGYHGFQRSYHLLAKELGRRPLALVLDLPAGPDKESFEKDVELLLEIYNDLFEPKEIGLRLSSLGKAMCPRFHVDRVLVRLICTYSWTWHRIPREPSCGSPVLGSQSPVQTG